MKTKEKLKLMRKVEQANGRHVRDWKAAQRSAKSDKEGKHEQADKNDRK